MVPLSTSNAACIARCLSVCCPSGRSWASTRALRPYCEAVRWPMLVSFARKPGFSALKEESKNDVSHYFIDTLICNCILEGR